MNTLFINLYEDTIKKEEVKKNKNIIKKNLDRTKIILSSCLNKITGFSFLKDAFSTSKNTSTYFLNIYKDIFFDSTKNLFLLKKLIKFKINNGHKLNIVFSKNFDDNIDLKLQIQETLNDALKDVEKNYISLKNNMKNLDMKYITHYIESRKIDLRKFKILIAIEKYEDLDVNKLIEYLDKYRYIDILKFPNMTKSDYSKVNSIITKLNDEYGSSMEVIQKRNIIDYNFYLIYSKNKKEFFTSHYVINNNAGILDLTSKDDDIFSNEYKSYFKNKYYISTVFNRVKFDIENFSKKELGIIYKN